MYAAVCRSAGPARKVTWARSCRADLPDAQMRNPTRALRLATGSVDDDFIGMIDQALSLIDPDEPHVPGSG